MLYCSEPVARAIFAAIGSSSLKESSGMSVSLAGNAGWKNQHESNSIAVRGSGGKNVLLLVKLTTVVFWDNELHPH